MPEASVTQLSALDPAPWVQFANAKTPSEQDQCWLNLQAALIPGTLLAVLARADDTRDHYSPVAIWPETAQDAEFLAQLVERVISERCGLVTALPAVKGNSGKPVYGVATPVFEDEQLHAVVAMAVEAANEAALQSVMGQLHWGSAWQELPIRRQRRAQDKAVQSRLMAATDLLASVLSKSHYEEAAMAFVTELATIMECSRVSLGFTYKGYSQVKAISHSAQFGKRMNLVRCIGVAMDEAVDQRQEIYFPPPEGQILPLTRDHRELSTHYDSPYILSIPLFSGEGYYGALTLERESAAFNEEDGRFAHSVAALAGPALEDKRRNDRWLWQKAGDSIKTQLQRLLGAHYLGRKLAVIVLAAGVVFFSFAQGNYHITSDAVLEGAVQRVVAAPFSGYVDSAEVRAGDLVKEGDLLLTLDDQELRLERMRWSSQRTQLQRQHQEALAEHDRPQLNILSAQIEQATAQLELVEYKLARTRISAPFNGLVVSGDLSQRLGSAVQQGDVLFEVTPLDRYRLILKLDERRITDVAAGQAGRLILASLPSESFDFHVTKVTAVAVAEEGMNYFRVEAELGRPSDRLRPGMEGIGKAYVDRRLLIGIWTRDLLEWMRLKWWAWQP